MYVPNRERSISSIVIIVTIAQMVVLGLIILPLMGHTETYMPILVGLWVDLIMRSVVLSEFRVRQGLDHLEYKLQDVFIMVRLYRSLHQIHRCQLERDMIDGI